VKGDLADCCVPGSGISSQAEVLQCIGSQFGDEGTFPEPGIDIADMRIDGGDDRLCLTTAAENTWCCSNNSLALPGGERRQSPPRSYWSVTTRYESAHSQRSNLSITYLNNAVSVSSRAPSTVIGASKNETPSLGPVVWVVGQERQNGASANVDQPRYAVAADCHDDLSPGNFKGGPGGLRNISTGLRSTGIPLRISSSQTAS